MESQSRQEPPQSWRTEPTAIEKARAGSPPPKSAFSIFLSPGAAKATEVARLLTEISKLQMMLGGHGIDYRLAGVRDLAPKDAEQ